MSGLRVTLDAVRVPVVVCTGVAVSVPLADAVGLGGDAVRDKREDVTELRVAVPEVVALREASTDCDNVEVAV